MDPADKKLMCVDCRKEFDFVVAEQEYLQTLYGENYKEPRRCKDCRRVRRLEKNRNPETPN